MHIILYPAEQYTIKSYNIAKEKPQVEKTAKLMDMTISSKDVKAEEYKKSRQSC